MNKSQTDKRAWFSRRYDVQPGNGWNLLLETHMAQHDLCWWVGLFISVSSEKLKSFKHIWKKFSWSTDKVAEGWTAGGNEFQMTDAATGNERQPTVVILLRVSLPHPQFILAPPVSLFHKCLVVV